MMRCLFHRWSRWEDVEETTRERHGSFQILVIPVRVQQRRCRKCNRAQRRST